MPILIFSPVQIIMSHPLDRKWCSNKAPFCYFASSLTYSIVPINPLLNVPYIKKCGDKTFLRTVSIRVLLQKFSPKVNRFRDLPLKCYALKCLAVNSIWRTQKQYEKRKLKTVSNKNVDTKFFHPNRIW